jgi:hypothetical protein
MYLYTCSSPWLQLSDGCILADYCNHRPLLIQNGYIRLLDVQLLVAASVDFDQSDVLFGSTINLVTLNSFADRVSTEMLTPPFSALPIWHTQIWCWFGASPLGNAFKGRL